jgi:CRP-like cAMP-binding protein
MRIPELGKVIAPGVLLGEIGIFASNKIRTATVICIDDCEVYEMSESKAKQLYFQDRTFGLAVLQLIISRLTEDKKLLQTAPITGENEGILAHPQKADPSLVHG